MLGGLLADLKDTIHAWDIAGRRLDKPLLIVIDEAGQLELGWLPAEVSTIAALGAFFVTCWQNLSQIQHRYTSLADAVLSGHRTKCFFAGIDDLATVRYLSDAARPRARHPVEHLPRRARRCGGERPCGRRSVSETVQREEFAPANTLRQMYPGEAVLLHGTLPPIHLDAVRWWQEKQLRGLVRHDDDGNPKAPDGIPTCPLTEDKAGEPRPVVDPATLQAALAQLPKAATPTGGHGADARSGGPTLGSSSSSDSDEATMPDPPPKRRTTLDLDQVTGRCDLCGQLLRPGEGAVDRQGRRTITRCAPSALTTMGPRPPLRVGDLFSSGG